MKDRPLFNEVFGHGGLFDSIFGEAAQASVNSVSVQTYGPERVDVIGDLTRIEIELPGVDPKTLACRRRGSRVVVLWTDRWGAAQTRSYDLRGLVENPEAAYKDGLLTLRAKTPAEKVSTEWSDVTISGL